MRRARNKKGNVVDLSLGVANPKPEKVQAADMERKYAKGKRKARK